MKFKRFLALAITAALIFTALAGCAPKEAPPSESDEGDASPDASASPSSSLNAAGAYEAFAPDTVMLTVNGQDVTWDSLFFRIHYFVGQMESQSGGISDWSAEYVDGITFSDYVLDAAVDSLIEEAAYKYGAAELDAGLTEQEREGIQATWQAQIDAAGGEDQFIAQLAEQYCTKEIFLEAEEISQLAANCFSALYGERGARLSDEEVAEHTAQDGFLMAKHILMLTSNEDDSPMTEEEKAQVLDRMEELHSQLNAYTGTDFEGFFDGFMNEHSQDPGCQAYPNGYLFQVGDMVAEFGQTAQELEIGGWSGPVETSYGYHIIYRLPVDYDAVPQAYSYYGNYSLRYLSAFDMFGSVVGVWTNSIDVVYSDAFQSIELGKLFAAG